MRILLASTAAAAIAITATPAFAQYGGSPTQQVESAPPETDMAPAPEDEGMPAEAAGDMLASDFDPDLDPDMDVETDLAVDTGGVAGGGKPVAEGEDYALADMDAEMPDMDMDVDADVDVDADTEMDAGELQPAVPNEAGESGDEADEAADEAGPDEQGEPSR